MSWIIIDGYNLVHAGDFQSRDALIRQLALYHRQVGHKVSVVFDAYTSGGTLAHTENTSSIEVIYSPITQNADSYIEELLRRKPHPPAIVVSSDRAVVKSAKAYGHTSVSSQDFVRRLKRITQSIGAAEEPQRMSPSLNDRESPSNRPSKRGGNPRRLSKKEKARRKTLSRL